MLLKIILSACIAFCCWVTLIECVSSPEKLLVQQTGYYSETKSQTTVVARLPDNVERNSNLGVCMQSRNAKHIDCHTMAGHASHAAFTFPHNLLGYQEFDVLLYGNNSPSDILRSPLLSISNITCYIVKLPAPNFAGLMDITAPSFGSIITNELYIEVEYHNLQRAGALTGYRSTARPDNLQFNFTVIGVIKGLYPGELSHLKSSGIEPGSWFYTITPVIRNSGAPSSAYEEPLDSDYLHGYPSYGYIEFVLSDEDIKKQRRYVNRMMENHKYSVESLQQHLHTHSTPKQAPHAHVGGSATQNDDNKVNICIWSSNTMDGQKRIWLQQIEHLDASKYRFTWMLTLTEGVTIADEVHRLEQLQRQGKESNSMLATVRRLFAQRGNGQIIDSPFNGIALDVEDLVSDPGDGRQPASETWGGDELELYRYAHESLIRANYSIDQVRPLWCRQFYAILRDALPPQRCSAIVYGNERGFSADVLVTDAARILRIPTVAELLNLFVHPEVVPILMIAPSTFAVEHESIQAVLNVGGALLTQASAIVVPPSVDTERFHPALFSRKGSTKGSATGSVKQQAYMHPKCQPLGPQDQLHDSPCINIGFIARLAPEKNVGLFMQSAYEILHLHPFARFTIVGDGPLRAPLEDLTARLQISWAVHFAGWVSSEQLPQLLAGMDVMINPSLRAWSETFCISNIEAMSMEVPLVTFAVGGIGEYVQDPQASVGVNGSLPDYSVSSNVVVVNRATPAAIAGAVQHLILHPALRKSIGRAGRETVLSYFTIDRQMNQYSAIYSALHIANT